jgi:serine/threonine protein kinase
VKKVRRADSSGDATTRFLKILKHQNDLERRKRMFREVAAYRTLRHKGVPSLIDTNADHYSHLDFKLYLVREFVEGQTLEQVIAERGLLPLNDAISLVIALLDVVDHCHANDVMHRDIKADNIILRNGRLDDPVLVDFGLSFNRAGEDEKGTATETELGNRSLRLPELAPGSPAKRDNRSDVTFCVGILFHALSGKCASQLKDGNDRLPHQAREITIADSGQRFAVLRLFDRGFRHDLDQRWQSVKELREELRKIAANDNSSRTPAEMMLTSIKAHNAAETTKHNEKVTTALREAHSRIDSVVVKVKDKHVRDYEISQQGYNHDTANNFAEQGKALARRGHFPTEFPRFRVSIIGSEVVYSVTYRGVSKDFYRTPFGAEEYDSVFEQEVENILIQQMYNDIQNQ